MKDELICPMCDGEFIVNNLNEETMKFIYCCMDCGYKGDKTQFADHSQEIKNNRLLSGENF